MPAEQDRGSGLASLDRPDDVRPPRRDLLEADVHTELLHGAGDRLTDRTLPGGAGLHSIEEYVNLEDVVICRDVLVAATRALMAS